MAINNARVVKAIRESMTNNFILSLTYKRERDNRQITRMVEPYEIKEMEDGPKGQLYLYAYDRTGGTSRVTGKRTRNIKTFLLENIVTAQSQKRVFKSRY